MFSDDITGTKNPTQTPMDAESVAGHPQQSSLPENNSLPGKCS